MLTLHLHLGLWVVTFLQPFRPNCFMHFSSSQCMLHVLHIPSSFYQPNNIWWKVQIMHSLLCNFHQPHHFFHLRSKYSTHPVHAHPQCVLPLIQNKVSYPYEIIGNIVSCILISVHEGENLQIWTVPANILSKQSLTLTWGSSPASELYRVLTTPLNKSYSQRTHFDALFICKYHLIWIHVSILMHHH